MEKEENVIFTSALVIERLRFTTRVVTLSPAAFPAKLFWTRLRRRTVLKRSFASRTGWDGTEDRTWAAEDT